MPINTNKLDHFSVEAETKASRISRSFEDNYDDKQFKSLYPKKHQEAKINQAIANQSKMLSENAQQYVRRNDSQVETLKTERVAEIEKLNTLNAGFLDVNAKIKMANSKGGYLNNLNRNLQSLKLTR